MKNKLLFIFLIYFVYLLCTISYADSASTDQLLKIGRDHLNLFQYENALKKFKQAADQNPESWEANFLTGSTYLSKPFNKIDDAEKYLSKAYKLNPSDLETQKALGSIYITKAKNAQNNGQTKKKMEFQLKACHIYPGATKIWNSLFEQWYDSGEYQKIKDESNFVFKNNQDLLNKGEDVSLQQALVVVARTYFREGDARTAESFLNHASKIRVNNDELYGLKRQIKNQEEEKYKSIILKVDIQISQKDFEKAIVTLKEALKISVTHTDEIENKIEECERSITLYKQISEIDELIKKEDFEKAYTKIDEALQAYPENAELEKRRKSVVTSLEEIQAKIEAEAEAKQEAEAKKRELESRIYTLKKEADKYENEKNYSKAIESLTKASKLDSRDKEIQDKIKNLQLLDKKARERQNHYTNSIVEIQDLMKMKNYTDCQRKLLDLRIEYTEKEEELSILLTECYLNQEKYKEAGDSSKILKDNKDNKDIYNFSQGMAAYKQGNIDEAKKYLDLVKSSRSNYKKITNKTLMIILFTNPKVLVGIGMVIITILALALPKLKELKNSSDSNSTLRKLEKIKETGSYEANFKFLKERYENQDVYGTSQKLVLLLYAAALQKKGDNKKAYQLISEYLKKDSRSPLAKNIAGETAMAIGETSPVALEQIQGLLKINDNRKDAVEYLAKAYMKSGSDHKVAQEYISKYISLNPNDTEAVIYMADIITKRGSFTVQTAKTLEKAIKLNPDNIDYYKVLVKNYKANGNEEEANRVQAIIDEKFSGYSQQQNQQDQFSDPYGFLNQNPFPNNGAQQNDYYSNQQDYNNQSYGNQGYDMSGYDQSNTNPNQQSYNLPSYDTVQQNSNDQQSFGLPNYNEVQSNATTQQSFGLPSLDSNTQQPSNNMGYNNNNGLDGLKDLDFNLEDFVNGGNQTQNIAQSTSQPVQQNQPPITGPKKNCPHCGAVNSANEYYCTTCGKPF